MLRRHGRIACTWMLLAQKGHSYRALYLRVSDQYRPTRVGNRAMEAIVTGRARVGGANGLHTGIADRQSRSWGSA